MAIELASKDRTQRFDVGFVLRRWASAGFECRQHVGQRKGVPLGDERTEATGKTRRRAQLSGLRQFSPLAPNNTANASSDNVGVWRSPRFCRPMLSPSTSPTR